MANSPLLFGPNNNSINLQNTAIMATGEQIQNTGARNYIGYNNFENALTTGWALGVTGGLTNGIPTGTPNFGAGASVNLSISTVSSGQLAGNYSLALVSSAATTLGDMLHSDPLTIEAADQAKVLTFKFYYSVPTNPSNGNFSGTASNSFGVAAYDVTNNSWLPVAGNFSMTQNAGVGIATGTFQTNLTTASLRFCIYNVTASAGAITINLDRLYVGPQTAPIGPVVTDWVSYAPVWSNLGTGTMTVNNGRYRRVGDSMEVQVFATKDGSGGSGSNAVQVTIPSGFTLDSAKNPNGTLGQSCGTGLINTATNSNLVAYYDPSNAGIKFYQNDNTSLLGSEFGAGLFIEGFFTVPIVGWSSNVQMSNDTDTRVVAMRASTNTARTINNTAPTIVYDLVTYDTHGAYNNSTGTYTAPVSGYYKFGGCYDTAAAVHAINNSIFLLVYRNGAQATTIATSRIYTTTSSQMGGAGSGEVFCNAGDAITFRIYSDTSNTLGASNAVSNWISVERLSGPAVIAATESVNAHYSNSSTTIANTGDTIGVFTVKDFDSHNAYNTTTGVYTVPVSGKYQINTSVVFVSGAYVAGNAVYAAIYKNGVVWTASGQVVIQTAITTSQCTWVSDIVPCVAGDAITLRFSNVRTAGNTALSGVAANTYFSIARVGN